MTKVKAWDYTWGETKHLHGLIKLTPNENRVKDSLAKLNNTDLPLTAILELAELCLAVESVIRERG